MGSSFLEYVRKGLFLGLWVFIGLQLPQSQYQGEVIGWMLGCMGLGLAVGLVLGIVQMMGRGIKPWNNWAAFPLLVLLESPFLISTGLLLGLAAGVVSGMDFAKPAVDAIGGSLGITWEMLQYREPVRSWAIYCMAGGVILGVGLFRMRQIEDPMWRLILGFVVGVLTVYAVSEYANKIPGLDNNDERSNLGLYILAGLPFFYLLTFVAEAEESEVEIMAICAGLGIAMTLMGVATVAPSFQTVGFLLPVTIYVVYAIRILPGLRIFKHTLRGFTYLNLGRLRDALYFFRRALNLDPKNELANQGMKALHQNLTLARIQADPELTQALDFTMCLDRAGGLLLGRTPSAADRDEAERFLEMVEQHKPALQARIDYLRSISLTHAKQFDEASGTLRKLLDPETPSYHPGVRQAVLFPAWELALRLHPEIVTRLGWGELDKPGRRIEAIAAVERTIAANPRDETAVELKRVLYSQLREGEFVTASATATPEWFNYDYVEQLGLALIDDKDVNQRERGMAYLRIAGRGLPGRGPSIFRKLAEAAEAVGDTEAMRGYLEQVKRSGLAVQTSQLAADQRDIFLTSLQRLATASEERGDFEGAIGDLRLYLESGGKQELATYRRLADLYGHNKDALNGLLMVETGLTYSSSDADFLKKKDTFYYSVTPEQIAAKKDRIERWFDTSYCVKKAMGVLNMKDDDPELLEWATHLAMLAKVMKPESAAVRLVEARCRLRRGERETALQMLEDLREGKKGSGDDEDAWYTATKLLGDMYLDELNRPELALACFKDYKEYGRSGADTLFKIARCYRALGDRVEAKRFYEAVIVYEQHPLRWEAESALRELKDES